MSRSSEPVSVLVREIDLEQAKEVLFRPPSEEDKDDAIDEADYLKRGYCPRCRTERLETKPFSPRWLRFRTLSMIMAGISVLLLFFQCITPIFDDWVWPCIFVTICAIVSAIAVVGPGEKHCPTCGWES